jgi:hypothetical protein
METRGCNKLTARSYKPRNPVTLKGNPGDFTNIASRCADS